MKVGDLVKLNDLVGLVIETVPVEDSPVHFQDEHPTEPHLYCVAWYKYRQYGTYWNGDLEVISESR